MCSLTTRGRRASVRAHSTAAPPVTTRTSTVSPVLLAARVRSDNLTNNELGWKTEFFDHRLQWNGAIYQEDWKNIQVSFFDPGLLGNVGFNANGPDYRIRGVETSIIAVLTPGLTAQGGASWNNSEQTNSPSLIANNPALLANPASAGEYGKPIL